MSNPMLESAVSWCRRPDPHPLLHPIHWKDPAVTWSEEWKRETEKCIRAFEYQPSSINIFRSGWEIKILDNSILLLIYIEELVDDTTALENTIRDSCLRVAPGCPGLQVRVGQGQTVRKNQPQIVEQIMAVGKKVTTEIIPSTKRTGTLGSHIIIRKNDQDKRAITTCHHCVSHSAEPLNGTEGSRVFCPSDNYRKDIIRELRIAIDECDKEERNLRARIDQISGIRRDNIQRNIEAVTKELERYDLRLHEKGNETEALEEKLERWEAPSTDWQCGTIICSSGLNNRTAIGGLSDWTIIEPTESVWPRNPNTFRKAGFDAKVKGLVPISTLRKLTSLPIDIDDPEWEQCEVFKPRGTSDSSSITSGYISHIKSDIWLPNHANGTTKFTEWVVVPKKWGTIFSSDGDSGGAVITAARPYRLCGNIFAGPTDNQVTYISDAPETFQAILERTGADEVLLA